MQLLEHREEGLLLVRSVTADTIRIGDREFGASLVLAPDRCIEAFPARHLTDLTPELIQPVLQLAPALVLIGTGTRQYLPSPALLAGFLGHGVGLETMDSHAAARTFNLLAGEGRRVVAIFLL